jgi:mannose-6-phosphate isomerase class I
MTRPITLSPLEMKKSWGSEQWLNPALPEASVKARNQPGTLTELIAAHPSLLGDWSRRLYGDQLPIFTKFLRADFPPLVHVGFSRAVGRETVLGWLAREQAALRQLLETLRIDSRAAFDDFARLYTDWATSQAMERWQRIDQEEIAARLRPFVRPEKTQRLALTMKQLRQNRAQLADVLNEVDLRREAGNLLLTPAGVVHAIFGLSHQTHPLDRTRPALEALFRNLRRLAQSGADDQALIALVDHAGLDELRARNLPPPKNEAWLPAMIGGQLMLVEPQQSSDTTYSLADFYTPFVWEHDRIRFRKGDAQFGLSSATLQKQLAEVDLSATSLDKIRRVPTQVADASSPQAVLYRLVDEPANWPWFIAYQLDLHGRPGAPARFQGAPAGVFQQLVVLSGELEILDEHGSAGTLSPAVPAFIPANVSEYQLRSTGAARLLLFSVPGPRGGLPHG